MDNFKNIIEKQLPSPKMCCFCISLRKGILIWSYFKLVLLYISSIVLFVTIGLHFLFVSWPQTGDIIGMLLFSIFAVMDMIFTNSLIIGVHTKNQKILRVCIYFSLIINLFYIINWLFLIIQIVPKASLDLWGQVALHGVMLSYFIINVYVCLLIRSEMKRIRADFGKCDVEFTHQINESE